MIKILKERSALTLVEVLVAVVLTAIVMLHGTVFFIATWRLNAESKDYNMVANDVVANLEKCVAMGVNPGGSGKGNKVFANANEYVIRNRTIRGLYTVTYSLEKTNVMYYQGFVYLISSARWRYNSAATNESDTIINIKTAYIPV